MRSLSAQRRPRPLFKPAVAVAVAMVAMPTRAHSQGAVAKDLVAKAVRVNVSVAAASEPFQFQYGVDHGT